MDKEDLSLFSKSVHVYLSIYLSIYLSFDVLGWVGWWVSIAMFWGSALYECLDIIIKAILDNNKICIAFNPFFKALYMDD
jgi:hypothetical protein